MKTSDWYLARAAISGILLALILLVALDVFLSLIGEFGDFGKGEYGMAQAVWYVILTIPRRIYTLFPTAAVVGALLGVGGLAATSELVALRAAGMSRLRIAAGVAISTFLLLIPVVFMGEVVGPAGERAGQSIRVSAQNADLAVDQGASIWVRDGDRFINAKRPLASKPDEPVTLADIDMFEFADGRLKSAAHADYAVHESGRWVLHDISRSYFEEDRVTTESVESEASDSLIEPELLKLAISRPKFLPLSELIPYVEYLDENGLNAGPYRAAMWFHIAYPLGALAVVFAGMPFVFGSFRSGGLGQRLFIGMLIGVGFYLVNRTASSLGEVYGLNAAASAFVPSLLLIWGSATLLRRSNF